MVVSEKLTALFDLLPWSTSQQCVQTPLVLQMEAVECGAASLGIVLGFHGKHVTLDELRVACGVSRDGSNALNVLKAARRYGCRTRSYRASSEDVLNGPFPVILFWNFNHFLVLEGATKTKVYLNDPAVGRRSVPISEFKKSFSGIVLSVEPGNDFVPGGTPDQPIVQIFQQMMEYRAQLGFVLLLGLLLVLPGFTIPNFAGVFVDHVVLQDKQSWLRPLIAGLLVAILFQLILSWLKFATLLNLGTHLTAKKSTQFLWYVLRLPAQFFALRYQGDIASRISSVQVVSELISSHIGIAVSKLFTASILFVLMVMLEPFLAIVAIVGALTNLIALRFLYRARFESSVKLSVDQGKLFASSYIGLKAIESLKASAREDDFFSKWAGYHARALISEQAVSRLAQLSGLMPAFVVMLTTAAALWIGGVRVIDSTLTLGAFVAFQALFAAVSEPVQQMMNTTVQTQKVAADLTRINDVLDQELDWRHSERSDTETSINQDGPVSLRFDKVRFGYNQMEPPLLDDFNLEIKSGGWTALVGASGCGKSTVGKLASGLYQPWSGTVTIDGVDITNIDRNTLANVASSVDQEIILFEGTYRDNLSLWDADVTHDQLVAAADCAQVLDLISSNELEFDGRVEENGRNFSGGERQRLEIARALIKSPSLLILDEATSALDPLTEFNVIQALRKRGVSCLIVAHRLSTIRDCDNIVVMDAGRVVEEGTHDELMASEGEYYRLIQEDDTT